MPQLRGYCSSGCARLLVHRRVRNRRGRALATAPPSRAYGIDDRERWRSQEQSSRLEVPSLAPDECSQIRRSPTADLDRDILFDLGWSEGGDERLDGRIELSGTREDSYDYHITRRIDPERHRPLDPDRSRHGHQPLSRGSNAREYSVDTLHLGREERLERGRERMRPAKPNGATTADAHELDYTGVFQSAQRSADAGERDRGLTSEFGRAHRKRRAGEHPEEANVRLRTEDIVERGAKRAFATAGRTHGQRAVEAVRLLAYKQVSEL